MQPLKKLKKQGKNDLFDTWWKNINYNLIKWPLRLKKIEQNMIKSVKSETVQKDPPTNCAAKYYSFKCYYQVQVWLENKSNRLGLEINEWQTSSYQNGYAPSSRSFNENYQCGFTLQCDTNKCTCKKNGLFCTQLCHNNTSRNYINTEDLHLDVID